MDSAHGLAEAAGLLGVTEEILLLAAHAKVHSVLTGEGAVHYGHGDVVVRDGTWRRGDQGRRRPGLPGHG